MTRLLVDSGEATPTASRVWHTVLEEERRQHTVANYSQLMALPGGTVVVDYSGIKYWREPTEPDEQYCWYPMGLDYGDDGHQIHLPARVMVGWE